MSRGINKAILVGNLGADPETKYTAGGTAITSIRVATSESWKDKQTGEEQTRVEWHRVKFFGRLAEIAGEYLKKGSQVYVEGKLRTDEYERDGVKKYSTDIIADEMQMLGGKPDGARQERTQRQAPAQERTTGGSLASDEDDIPFSSPITRRTWSVL